MLNSMERFPVTSSSFKINIREEIGFQKLQNVWVAKKTNVLRYSLENLEFLNPRIYYTELKFLDTVDRAKTFW